MDNIKAIMMKMEVAEEKKEMKGKVKKGGKGCKK